MPAASFDRFPDSTSGWAEGSGPYVFLPIEGQVESITYTEKISEPTILLDASGDPVGMSIDFGEPFNVTERFYNSGPENEKLFKRASLSFSFDEDFIYPTVARTNVKFFVDLGGLPRPNYSDGNEVIV